MPLTLESPWWAFAALGAFHGINPGMGWLFAVALGMQRRALRVVLIALVPIALGHELSVVVVTLVVIAAGGLASLATLRVMGAVGLIAFGAFKLLRPRSHPKWVGMNVGYRDLVLWSFLMASAHGAGLMLFPLLIGATADSAHAAEAHLMPLSGAGFVAPVLATLVHTAAMLATMAVIASVVYVKVGLAILRSAWINFDAVWAAALLITGLATLFG
ncbi:MAG: hypothetical protein U0821_04025 [Chloroflexota bacterium]